MLFLFGLQLGARYLIVNRLFSKRLRLSIIKMIKKLLVCISLILYSTLVFTTNCYADEPSYVFSETEDCIYNTLRAAGYTKAGACGILGNMSVENPWFEPDIYGNGGITYGLFQWNNVGERKDNLDKWCKNRSLSHKQVEGQLAFAIHELSGGDPIAKRANDFLKSCDKPRVAAMEFAVGFERCIGSSPSPENDAEYEGFIYPEYFGRTYQALKRRMDAAEKYYDGYVSDEIDPRLVYKVDAIPTPGLISEIEDKMQIDIQRSIVFRLDASESDNQSGIYIVRALCVFIGYLCGCVYLSLLLVDREKLKANRMNKMKQIPHMRSVISHFGVKKAALFFINDILKLFIAIVITSMFINSINLNEIILFTGFGVIIGNAFPFWNKFSGGIGFTVTILTLILYMPIWGVLCCVIGMFFATVLRSLTVGVIIMSFTMIPFAYHYKGVYSAVVVTLIMLLLVASHQRILLKYFDRNVIHNHYLERRKMFS